MKRRQMFLLIIGFLCMLIVGVLVITISSGKVLIGQGGIVTEEENIGKFNGQRALADVHYQVALGPRTPGSYAHSQVVTWLSESMAKLCWQTEIQETEMMGQPAGALPEEPAENPEQ